MQVSLRSRHYHYACYRPEPGLSDLFRELSDFEEGASGELAARMVQLRGTPDFRVESLALRSHVRFTPVSDPEEMVQEVLVAARVQIETQCAAVRWLAEDDPTTRRLIESLLAQVEAFAERLSREQSGITSEETEDSRIEGERERWSQAPDKPPWWDPQWIARS